MSYLAFDIDEVVRETDLALLLRFEDGDEVWIPKSVIESVDQIRDGDAELEVSIAEWFCEKEGLV